MVGRELLDDLKLEFWALRRNVVTSGIDLLDLIGLEFAIGSARFRGAGPCSPCRYIEGLNGRPGLLREIDRRSGLRAAVLERGVVHVGDEFSILGVAEAR